MTFKADGKEDKLVTNIVPLEVYDKRVYVRTYIFRTSMEFSQRFKVMCQSVRVLFLLRYSQDRDCQLDISVKRA